MAFSQTIEKDPTLASAYRSTAISSSLVDLLANVARMVGLSAQKVEVSNTRPSSFNEPKN